LNCTDTKITQMLTICNIKMYFGDIKYL